MADFEPIPLTPVQYSTSPATSIESGLFLHIENACVAELPEEGEITFRYKRGPVTLVGSTKDSPARAYADFNLTEITCCEACKSEEDSDTKKTESRIDELLEEALESESEKED